jgi:hypothetical protein
VGWNVPANAVELAQKIAKDPPITRNGNTLQLRPPADPAEQRAITCGRNPAQSRSRISAASPASRPAREPWSSMARRVR